MDMLPGKLCRRACNRLRNCPRDSPPAGAGVCAAAGAAANANHSSIKKRGPRGFTLRVLLLSGEFAARWSAPELDECSFREPGAATRPACVPWSNRLSQLLRSALEVP